jgi:hypothetical protein
LREKRGREGREEGEGRRREGEGGGRYLATRMSLNKISSGAFLCF